MALHDKNENGSGGNKMSEQAIEIQQEGTPSTEDDKNALKAIESKLRVLRDKMKDTKDWQIRLNFGEAIEALKKGERVARNGWNGKKMFLFLVKPVGIEYKKELPEQYEYCEHIESIAMKTADDKILVGWLASQNDILAEDWEIVE